MASQLKRHCWICRKPLLEDDDEVFIQIEIRNKSGVWEPACAPSHQTCFTEHNKGNYIHYLHLDL